MAKHHRPTWSAARCGVPPRPAALPVPPQPPPLLQHNEPELRPRHVRLPVLPQPAPNKLSSELVRNHADTLLLTLAGERAGSMPEQINGSPQQAAGDALGIGSSPATPVLWPQPLPPAAGPQGHVPPLLLQPTPVQHGPACGHTQPLARHWEPCCVALNLTNSKEDKSLICSAHGRCSAHGPHLCITCLPSCAE